jgi:hypothetical protein
MYNKILLNPIIQANNQRIEGNSRLQRPPVLPAEQKQGAAFAAKREEIAGDSQRSEAHFQRAEVERIGNLLEDPGTIVDENAPRLVITSGARRSRFFGRRFHPAVRSFSVQQLNSRFVRHFRINSREIRRLFIGETRQKTRDRTRGDSRAEISGTRKRDEFIFVVYAIGVIDRLFASCDGNCASILGRKGSSHPHGSHHYHNR